MALIRVRVDPPTPVTPPYGLLSVAQVVEDATPHWRTGVEYDTFACHESKVWGQWCTGTGEPSPVSTTRTITVTLTGDREPTGDTGEIALSVRAAESDPTGYTAVAQWDAQDYSYGVNAEASVDGGPERQIKFHTEVGTDDYTVVRSTGQDTGDPTIAIADKPIHGVVAITDVLTGVTINAAIRQNSDGSLEQPEAPIVIAVPEPGIPAGCFGITTTFTAAPSAEGTTADVTIAATTTSQEPRRLIVYVGGTRTVVETGQTPAAVVSGLGAGFYRISVRDVKSDSFVSGWLYIDDTLMGQAQLVQPTCPVKEITTAPWQTLDADPFTVYAEVICKAVAFPEASRSAREALELSQARAVERYYWDSLIERAQTVTPEVVGIVRGLAELEQYIASVYNGTGVIHVSPWGVEYLAHAHLLDSSRWRGRYGNASSGEALRTWRGTPIVVGHGYPREATDVQATGHDFWMFVTGHIVVRHSDIGVIETFNQRTNDKSAVAERTFVVTDDCPIPGVVHVSPQEVR